MSVTQLTWASLFSLQKSLRGREWGGGWPHMTLTFSNRVTFALVFNSWLDSMSCIRWQKSVVVETDLKLVIKLKLHDGAEECGVTVSIWAVVFSVLDRTVQMLLCLRNYNCTEWTDWSKLFHSWTEFTFNIDIRFHFSYYFLDEPWVKIPFIRVLVSNCQMYLVICNFSNTFPSSCYFILPSNTVSFLYFYRIAKICCADTRLWIWLCELLWSVSHLMVHSHKATASAVMRRQLHSRGTTWAWYTAIA